MNCVVFGNEPNPWNEPCQNPRPFWIGQKTYTAACLAGMKPISVTVTRQAKSYVSQEDADRLARAMAKAAAEAALDCHFSGTKSVIGECGYEATATAISYLSQEDADALALAEAAALAAEYCGYYGGGSS